jgi:hypothetical protein
MTDLERAKELLGAIERGDSAAALALYSERIRGYASRGWSVEDYIRDVWMAGLDQLAGAPRQVVGEDAVSPTAVRFTIEGPLGRAYATFSFEEDGVGGSSLERSIFEGIGNLVINCPWDRHDEVVAFYGALFGTDRWRIPRIVFDEGLDHSPGWNDPDRPQQLHVEAEVRDLGEASELLVGRGATLLEEREGQRTYADPLGHALTLIGADVPADGPVGRLARIVIDCPAPVELATFYQELLKMPERREESAERVVIADSDGRPELAFRRLDPYVSPRWPDPAFPAQMHFDLKFYDARAAIALAMRLGAKPLPKGGSCPVYADPADHPFCLCMHGQ